MRLGTNGVHRVIPPSTTVKTRCPMRPVLLNRHGGSLRIPGKTPKGRGGTVTTPAVPVLVSGKWEVLKALTDRLAVVRCGIGLRR